jgi:hypothetical protein
VRLKELSKLKKKSNNLMETQTRDLPACNIVTQPTTISRAPLCSRYEKKKKKKKNMKLWSEDLRDHFGPLSVERMNALKLKQHIKKCGTMVWNRYKWPSKACNGEHLKHSNNILNFIKQHGIS